MDDWAHLFLGSLAQAEAAPPGMTFLMLISLGLVLFTFAISLVRLYVGIGILIVSMLFSPEVVVGWTHQREIIVRLEDLLVLAIVLAWITANITERRTDLVLRTPLNRPIWIYLSVLLLSTFWGFWFFPHRFQAEFSTAMLYFLKVLQFFLIYFLTVSALRNRGQVVALTTVLLLTAVMVVVYGLYQAFVLEVARVSTPMEGDRPEPNTLGGYLILILALSMCIFLYAPPHKRWLRPAMLVLLAATGLCMMYTLSRASFIAFVCTMLLLSAVQLLQREWNRGLGTVLALALFLILMPFVSPGNVRERVEMTFQPSVSQPETAVVFMGFRVPVDSSTAERFGVWEKVTWNFLHHPIKLIGYGINYQQILDSQWARLVTEGGILGVLAFAWLLWRIGRMAWYVYAHSDDWLYRAFALGYLVALLGLLVHSFGTITFYIVRIMEPFWFMTGVVAFIYVRELRGNAFERTSVARTTAAQKAAWPAQADAALGGVSGPR